MALSCSCNNLPRMWVGETRVLRGGGPIQVWAWDLPISIQWLLVNSFKPFTLLRYEKVRLWYFCMGRVASLLENIHTAGLSLGNGNETRATHRWGMCCGRSWWSSVWCGGSCRGVGTDAPSPECCSPHSSGRTSIPWRSDGLERKFKGLH